MEEFSVRELSDYRWHRKQENDEKLEDLVATNLAVSGFRDYDLEPDLSEMDAELALSTLVHDAAVELYSFNEELDLEGFFELMSAGIERRVAQTPDLDGRILLEDIHGYGLEELLWQMADYYDENFQEGEDIETEEVLENNDFYGRADVIRDVEGEREMRDVKTHYSRLPVPEPQDKFKMACYALISRNERDIDRFVLDYPLQKTEFEIETHRWFSEVVETAEEFRSILEGARTDQARLMEPFVSSDNRGDPREFVENLDIPYDVNKAYARSATQENIL